MGFLESKEKKVTKAIRATQDQKAPLGNVVSLASEETLVILGGIIT
ncbi:hypothetical protein lerEdw1_020201 [Lerista edwardsae]|nr:hypothetical protein lerEdw1_020201 [Lerista edwardsae]